MKLVLTGFIAALLLTTSQSCTSKHVRYVDLNTGTPFELVKDPTTGLMVDVETGKPLNIYVDLSTRDTVYGRSGKVINGQVQKIDKSLYAYTGAENELGVEHIAGNVDAVPEDKSSDADFINIKGVE
jgi:hypothetical protein